MNEKSIDPTRETQSARLYEPQVLLAFMPPSKRQRRVALAIVLVLSIIFVITAPFIYYPLPPVNGFIPAFDTAVFICDLITASLLVAGYTISRSRALLVLASGYLFTALIVIPHALTFLGAFTRTDLLDARSQGTAWLYAVWHFGFALSVLGYVLLKDVDRGAAKYQGSAVAAIGSTVAIVIALVCVLSWVITAQQRYLPRIIGTDLSFIGRHGPGIGMVLVGGLALVLLWRRQRSVLDLWLMVVMFAFLFEVGRLVGGPARFSLGFYASRIYSLTTATTILLLFLSETTTIYARLATAVIRERHERDSRHLTMDAAMASIAHEVNQPLAAIVTNANAGLRWLTNDAPNLDAARATMKNIVSAGHRAGEVIESIRAMFKKDRQERSPIELNDVIRDVLALLREELQMRGILVQTQLASPLPLVLGQSGQLQQVIWNLVRNAADAMDSVTGRARVLTVKTEIHNPDGILLSVEDSGTGIDPKNTDRIFETFFTTKSQGMGMGLSICRSIIEAHDGKLWASSGVENGSVFNILLPAVRLPQWTVRYRR